MTFWGAHERMGLLPYFVKIVELSPPSHQAATMDIGETQTVAESMLRSTSFQVVAHGTVEVVAEWPDVTTAVRALAAAGPAVPAIEAVGYDDLLRRAAPGDRSAARPRDRGAGVLRTGLDHRPTRVTLRQPGRAMTVRRPSWRPCGRERGCARPAG